ncbi:MAG: hypothetical protein ABI629_14695 [bacterium]
MHGFQRIILTFLLLSAVLVGRVAAQTPTPTPGGDCCTAHAGPSCNVQACSDCVCDSDAPCCLNKWDAFCVADATDLQCASVCGCGQTPVPTPTPGGDCCSVHADGRGCDSTGCQECVCGIDAECCSETWDATCVSEAQQECGADCPCVPPPTQTPAPTATPGGDCCDGHDGVGCDDSACQACVCGKDSDCCNDIWDETCAQEAAIDCASACATCPAPGDCCASHDGVSCDDARCKACVCDTDAACCTDSWDVQCVQEAGAECALECLCEDAGSCCAGHDGVGCEDRDCQDCVCELDEPCCGAVWDETCAQEAASSCGSRCAECTTNNCCAPREAAGCSQDACEACVCEIDGPCCSGVWDQQCASEAAQACQDVCACQVVSACPGDCDNDDEVTVSNLIIAVNIALGSAPVGDCTAIDTDGNGDVTVSELIQAVNAALNGCPAA